MPKPDDDAEERAKRAEALRAKIAEVISDDADEKDDAAVTEEQGAEESDRDFVERRMREERESAREDDED